jgi:predicted dehydrogenase
VVVEKPFTPTSVEAEELVALAKKQGVLLTVYQNRRWDADFVTLSHYIKNGSLGRIVEFETHFDRHRPQVPVSDSWKYQMQPGGGVVYDLGTHLMDQVVHLFGMPKRITGFVGTQRENNTTGFEDSCTILLHYDGMLATVKAGVVSPEVNQLRYWVRGDKGSFRKFHLDCQEDQLRAGMRPGDQGYGVEPEDRHGVLSISHDGKITSEVVPTLGPATYVEYYRSFAAALKGDKDQIPVDPAVAAGVIRLVELARESSKVGRTLDV